MTEPHSETLALLARLIAFPTVSAESNLALVDFAEHHLRQAGFTAHRLASPDETKAGLMARLSEGQGGVMLSAHSDVVPVAGQDWSRPPFRLTREGANLYGRGTTDMKGFLAAMLSSASRAGKTGLARPLMLAISYDEELGCTGIRHMLPGMEALGWQPAFCIVGEPTGMRPAIGHKGKAALVATCHGTAGHSSLAPRHVNALHLAAEFVAALRRIQSDYAGSALADDAYGIPYSTVHAGRMQGGTALNIVPDRAVVEFEFRHLPGDALPDFQSRLRAEVQAILAQFPDPAADIRIATTNTYPGLDIVPDHPVVEEVARLCGHPQRIKVTYGTEAGYFLSLGIPTVVCGPGDMEAQGHKPDEFLTVPQLAACDRMLDGVLARLRA
ncbi:acetylornithine deacetylase [Paracoccus sp. AS002]|uniref:acetylornithine deacetylase n=1 Tax=Paracoccus sp. AS002 TaxID=3019545 RepID=UPI0023E8D4F2|nr:acetylornithine deacetylase [Paracoccus sp. AS002]MDF3907458.1 acetylornithine deacetylase [Paracoccus sp. AS002]